MEVVNRRVAPGTQRNPASEPAPSTFPNSTEGNNAFVPQIRAPDLLIPETDRTPRAVLHRALSHLVSQTNLPVTSIVTPLHGGTLIDQLAALGSPQFQNSSRADIYAAWLDLLRHSPNIGLIGPQIQALRASTQNPEERARLLETLLDTALGTPELAPFLQALERHEQRRTEFAGQQSASNVENRAEHCFRQTVEVFNSQYRQEVERLSNFQFGTGDNSAAAYVSLAEHLATRAGTLAPLPGMNAEEALASRIRLRQQILGTAHSRIFGELQSIAYSDPLHDQNLAERYGAFAAYFQTPLPTTGGTLPSALIGGFPNSADDPELVSRLREIRLIDTALRNLRGRQQTHIADVQGTLAQQLAPLTRAGMELLPQSAELRRARTLEEIAMRVFQVNTPTSSHYRMLGEQNPSLREQCSIAAEHPRRGATLTIPAGSRIRVGQYLTPCAEPMSIEQVAVRTLGLTAGRAPSAAQYRALAQDNPGFADQFLRAATTPSSATTVYLPAHSVVHRHTSERFVATTSIRDVAVRLFSLPEGSTPSAAQYRELARWNPGLGSRFHAAAGDPRQAGTLLPPGVEVHLGRDFSCGRDLTPRQLAVRVFGLNGEQEVTEAHYSQLESQNPHLSRALSQRTAVLPGDSVASMGSPRFVQDLRRDDPDFFPARAASDGEVVVRLNRPISLQSAALAIFGLDSPSDLTDAHLQQLQQLNPSLQEVLQRAIEDRDTATTAILSPAGERPVEMRIDSTPRGERIRLEVLRHEHETRRLLVPPSSNEVRAEIIRLSESPRRTLAPAMQQIGATLISAISEPFLRIQTGGNESSLTGIARQVLIGLGNTSPSDEQIVRRSQEILAFNPSLLSRARTIAPEAQTVPPGSVLIVGVGSVPPAPPSDATYNIGLPTNRNLRFVETMSGRPAIRVESGGIRLGSLLEFVFPAHYEPGRLTSDQRRFLSENSLPTNTDFQVPAQTILSIHNVDPPLLPSVLDQQRALRLEAYQVATTSADRLREAGFEPLPDASPFDRSGRTLRPMTLLGLARALHGPHATTDSLRLQALHSPVLLELLRQTGDGSQLVVPVGTIVGLRDTPLAELLPPSAWITGPLPSVSERALNLGSPLSDLESQQLSADFLRSGQRLAEARRQTQIADLSERIHRLRSDVPRAISNETSRTSLISFFTQIENSFTELLRAAANDPQILPAIGQLSAHYRYQRILTLEQLARGLVEVGNFETAATYYQEIAQTYEAQLRVDGVLQRDQSQQICAAYIRAREDQVQALLQADLRAGRANTHANLGPLRLAHSFLGNLPEAVHPGVEALDSLRARTHLLEAEMHGRRENERGRFACLLSAASAQVPALGEAPRTGQDGSREAIDGTEFVLYPPAQTRRIQAQFSSLSREGQRDFLHTVEALQQSAIASGNDRYTMALAGLYSNLSRLDGLSSEQRVRGNVMTAAALLGRDPRSEIAWRMTREATEEAQQLLSTAQSNGGSETALLELTLRHELTAGTQALTAASSGVDRDLSLARVRSTVSRIVTHENQRIAGLTQDSAALELERSNAILRIRPQLESQERTSEEWQRARVDFGNTSAGRIWHRRENSLATERRLHLRANFSAEMELARALVIAGRGQDAEEHLRTLRQNYRNTTIGSEVTTQVDRFFVERQRGSSIEAALRQGAREWSDSHWSEALLWTQSGGATGAAIVFPCPPLGYAIGCGVGALSLGARNLIRGSDRVGQAWGSRMTDVGNLELALGLGAVGLDAIPIIGGPIAGARSVGVSGLRQIVNPQLIRAELNLLAGSVGRRAVGQSALELANDAVQRASLQHARTLALSEFAAVSSQWGARTIFLGGMGLALGPAGYELSRSYLDPNLSAADREQMRSQLLNSLVPLGVSMATSHVASGMAQRAGNRAIQASRRELIQVQERLAGHPSNGAFENLRLPARSPAASPELVARPPGTSPSHLENAAPLAPSENGTRSTPNAPEVLRNGRRLLQQSVCNEADLLALVHDMHTSGLSLRSLDGGLPANRQRLEQLYEHSANRSLAQAIEARLAPFTTQHLDALIQSVPLASRPAARRLLQEMTQCATFGGLRLDTLVSPAGGTLHDVPTEGLAGLGEALRRISDGRVLYAPGSGSLADSLSYLINRRMSGATTPAGSSTEPLATVRSLENLPLGRNALALVDDVFLASLRNQPFREQVLTLLESGRLQLVIPGQLNAGIAPGSLGASSVQPGTVIAQSLHANLVRYNAFLQTESNFHAAFEQLSGQHQSRVSRPQLNELMHDARARTADGRALTLSEGLQQSAGIRGLDVQSIIDAVEHNARVSALTSPTLDRLVQIDPRLVTRQPEMLLIPTSRSSHSEALVARLNGDVPGRTERIASSVARTLEQLNVPLEHRDLIRRALLQSVDVFSESRLHSVMRDMQQRITELARAHGSAPDQVVFILPRRDKSYQAVVQMYRTANNLPPGRFLTREEFNRMLQGRSASERSRITAVVLDDFAGSGRSLETVRREISDGTDRSGITAQEALTRRSGDTEQGVVVAPPFTGQLIIAPIASTEPASRRINVTGPNTHLVPGTTHQGVTATPWFRELTQADADIVHTYLGRQGFGKQSTTIHFPWGGPNNNNLLWMFGVQPELSPGLRNAPLMQADQSIRHQVNERFRQSPPSP